MPFAIFPLFPIDNGACGCRDGAACERIGKHPAYAWSTLKPGQAVTRKGSGHGIATGVRSGIFVVDTDGEEADAVFRARLDGHPVGMVVRTPGGGRHYYFAHPGFPVRNSVKELLPNVDIRGDGGFVVAPDSPHKSGGTYRVEGEIGTIGPAPAWILDWEGLRNVRGDLEPGANAPTPILPSDPEFERRVAKAIEVCKTADPSIEGEGGHGALFFVAMKLVRTYELPVDIAALLIVEHFNPRCVPKWSTEEIDRKVIEARDKGQWETGILSVGALRLPVTLAAPSRRKKDPAHVYEHEVGDACATKPSKADLSDVLQALRSHPSWAGVLQYDAFRDRVHAVDPPVRLEGAEGKGLVDADVTSIRDWFRCVGGMSVSKETAWEAVLAVARTNPYHPVRDYLEGLPAVEDPSATLDNAARIFFCSDDPLDRMYLRRFMIGAVRRVLVPGTKLDTMLVLVGDQGRLKSTFVRELFGADFVAEDLADLASKDSMIGLAGRWAVEVAELDKMLRASPDTVKAFVSRRVDSYRPPYERATVDRPRECCYVGTSNRDDFLRDATGERRYWIIPVQRIDIGAVQSWRDRMWSAALAMAKTDESHWIDADSAEAVLAEARAEPHKESDEWHGEIVSACKGKRNIRIRDIWIRMGEPIGKLDRKAEMRIANILRRIGCKKRLEGLTRVRTWDIPSSLETDTPDAISAAEVKKLPGPN
jgi:predicted P-loop ATPase